MVWEERFAQMGRRLEIREEMVQKLIGIGPAGVPVFVRTMLSIAILLPLVVLPMSAVGVRRLLALAIVEDDDFVDREDGSGASYLTG